MKFDELINKIKSAKPNTALSINGVDRTVVFAASYYSDHFPEREYYKVFFSDGTVLEVEPETEEIYFCDDDRRVIDRSLITDYGEYLNKDGKRYLLSNADDKQHLKIIYFGPIEDGEGECVFSDFISADEVWRLATMDNGSFSDLHARKISLSDLNIPIIP